MKDILCKIEGMDTFPKKVVFNMAILGVFGKFCFALFGEHKLNVPHGFHNLKKGGGSNLSQRISINNQFFYNFP